MMHVGMNIEDKPRLFAEVRRVLRNQAASSRSSTSCATATARWLPVHWAASAETSFVASAAAYRQALEAAGFEIVKERDRGAFAREFFRQVTARIAEAEDRRRSASTS